MAAAADAFEITLIGPGYGECVVVRVGSNEWIVVDSCVRRREPLAKTYLQGLGVDLADVKLIVATHWHDDHIGGIGQLVGDCPNASVAVSAVLSEEIVRQHVGGASEPADDPDADPTMFSSGVREYKALCEVVGQRPPGLLRHLDASSAVKLLYKHGDASVWAVAPSVAEVQNGIDQIAAFLAQPDRRSATPKPNDASVVLVVRAGDRSALLGADLERKSYPGAGWQAIVALDERADPDGDREIEVVKVPHHGSYTGHDDCMWDALLDDRPMALLAPWTRGRYPIPTEADLERIGGRALRLLCTGLTNRTLERTPSPYTRARPIDDFGHVTFTAPLSGPADWTVSVRGGAFDVECA